MHVALMDDTVIGTVTVIKKRVLVDGREIMVQRSVIIQAPNIGGLLYAEQTRRLKATPTTTRTRAYSDDVFLKSLNEPCRMTWL